MPGNGVIPPVPASDVEEDPFAPEEPRMAANAGDEWTTAFIETEAGESLPPPVPSSALDPMPPQIDGKELSAAMMAQFMLRRQLERATDPLRKAFGPSIDALSKLGYSEPVLDPGNDDLRSVVQQAVRKI